MQDPSHKKTNTLGFCIDEISRGVKFIETERWWWPGAAGGENGSCCFMGRVSHLQEDKTSGDLVHNSANVLNAVELYPQKMS